MWVGATTRELDNTRTVTTHIKAHAAWHPRPVRPPRRKEKVLCAMTHIEIPCYTPPSCTLCLDGVYEEGIPAAVRFPPGAGLCVCTTQVPRCCGHEGTGAQVGMPHKVIGHLNQDPPR
jgi:hypothetical protein